MNKDTVNGTIDDVVGSAKRHIGNMTGNTGTQVKGAVQQLKGKAEKAVGRLKDAGRDAQANYNAQRSSGPVVVERREVVVSDIPMEP
jgi:uncharacterized protein YjbJ (UPF0337 family)